VKNDYPNALKYYDEVLVVDSGNYDVKANKALVLHATERYNDAIVVYKELIVQQPNNRLQVNLESALSSQGYLLLEKGDNRSAISCFNEVIGYDVNEASAYHGLAQAYEKLNSIEKATENYEKAIDIEPDNKDYRSDYEKFIAKNKLKNNVVAEEKTKLPQPIVPKAQIVPDNEHALIKAGDSLYNQKKYDEAVMKYLQALGMNDNNATTCLKLGNLYKLKKDATNSSIFYQKALKIDPSYTDAWFNLGLVYAETGNYSDCKKCLSRVIVLDPSYTYAYYAMGLAYESEKNNEKAIEFYQRFANLNKDEKTNQDVINKINSLKQ